MATTRPSARAAVLRSALLFIPFLVVTLIALAFIVRDIAADGASGGRVVATVLVSFVAALLAYQVIQSLRDLATTVVETTGVVERRWSRNDFFLFRNSYIFVDRDVYRLQPEEFLHVDLGDTIRIVHYPHTSAVEQIEVVERASRPARQDDA